LHTSGNRLWTHNNKNLLASGFLAKIQIINFIPVKVFTL
jgi:hypothetical protein